MHDPNVLQFSPFPLPNCGTPHLVRSASALLELTGGSLKICRTLVCALHCGSKVLDICAVLVEHDRQTADKLLKIGAPLGRH